MSCWTCLAFGAAGFWDVARTTRSQRWPPIPMPTIGLLQRNLTDDHLRAVRDHCGLVGLSLSVSELRRDGHNDAETPLALIRHRSATEADEEIG